MIYTREAHAIDGKAPNSSKGAPLVEEPGTLEERAQVAKTCVKKLDLAPLKTLIDGMDDGTSEAYASFPDRLYLVGKDGKIAYAGGKGPRGFVPADLEDAVRTELKLKPLEREPTERRRRR